MLNKTETKMEWEIEKNERKEEEKKKKPASSKGTGQVRVSGASNFE